MPSRWLTAAIVLFWLATTGWLFWRDLWPAWRPGEPPPFHIDLVEEVQSANTMHTSWTVKRKSGKDKDEKNVFTVSTGAEYHPTDDTFTLQANFDAMPRSKASSVSVANFVKIAITNMKSEYRVNRQGQLQSLHAAIKGKLHLKDQEKDQEMDAEASLWGEVRDEQFFTHYRLSAAGNPLEGDLNPVPVSYHDSILMPLHPVNRIHGLKPGRSWRQAVVDPFRDAFPTLSGFAGGVHYLQARVLDEPQILREGKEARTCLVIEYTGEDMSAKTWVELDSERVQRQEFTLGNDTWIIQRDPSKHSL